MTTPPSNSRKPLTPWLILALVVLAAAVPFLLRQGGGEDLVAWRTDMDAAFAEAGRVNKPVLMYFTADWCPPCKMMKRWTFSDRRVKQQLEANYVPLRVDMTARSPVNDAMGARFKLAGWPTFIVASPAGQELRREVGGMGADDFIVWISR